jgi:hypothetical protein
MLVAALDNRLDRNQFQILVIRAIKAMPPDKDMQYKSHGQMVLCLMHYAIVSSISNVVIATLLILAQCRELYHNME